MRKSEEVRKDSPNGGALTSIDKPSSASRSFRSRLRRRFSPRESIAELRNPGLWNDTVNEAIMCVYLECTLIWVGITVFPDMYKVNITHIGIWAALQTFVLFESFGALSGASMSPARTFAYFIIGRYTAARAAAYTVAQVAGCAAGAMIGYWLTPPEIQHKISAIVPSPGVTPVMAMAIEGLMVYALTFIGIVVNDPRKPSNFPAVAVGFTIGSGVLAAGSYTGALQNPAVAFGPAVASGNFTNHWPYWVGPYIGATVSAIHWLITDYVRTNYDPRFIDRRHDASRAFYDNDDDECDNVRRQSEDMTSL